MGTVLLLVGLFFGLKPVYFSETTATGIGNRGIGCGSAWNRTDLTSFREARCEEAGLGTNRTVSVVLVVTAGVLLFVGPSVLRKATSEQRGLVATPAEDLRACPFCAEHIKKAAVVCRFCNRDVPPAT